MGENSAGMAADTVMNFLETGSIRNSVNFPTAILPPKDGSTFRLCIVHANKPGVLGEITSMMGEKSLNITQQINTSRDEIAYPVIDTDTLPPDVEMLEKDLAAKCQDIISIRFLGDP